jgi:anti-sigma factor RsiW
MSALLQESCREFAGSLGPFLDGELDAQAMLYVQTHVVDCASCREQLELLRATRGSLKRAVRMPAPEGLRSRVATAMTAERTRGDLREATARGDEKDSRVFGWRTMVPLATAAALALFFGTTRAQTPRAPGAEAQLAGVTGADDLLATFLDAHARPPGPPTKDVGGLSQYVGVPVQPARFEHGGAQLIGGRVLPVRQERAAMLEYVIRDSQNEPRSVSFMIYPAQSIRVNDARLTPRAVGTAQVRVGKVNGWSVAVTQNDGVGCAGASDLDLDRTAQLVAMGCDEQ